MQSLNRIGLILLWLAAPLVAFAAANKNDPYLLVLRGVGNIALVVTSIVIVIVLLRRGRWRTIVGKLLVMLWCVPSVLMSNCASTMFLPPVRLRRVSSGLTSWSAIPPFRKSRAWPSRA
jgi:hypothetical protein